MANRRNAAAAAAEEPAAPALKTPSKAKFVTVASKLPMNIELQLTQPQTSTQTGQHGSTKETVHVKVGPVWVIRGTAYPEKAPKDFPRRPDMIEDDNGGYALTPRVDAEFMERWMEQNADTDMVRNGIIKVQVDLDSLAADAAEHASVDSGLGPLNPEDDRRNPRPTSTSIEKIKREEARA